MGPTLWWKARLPNSAPTIGTVRPSSPKTWKRLVWENAITRLPADAAPVASAGLRRAAITGTITISSERNAGPPMKGDNGKNPLKAKTDARQAESAISEVVTDPDSLVSAMVDYLQLRGL